MNVILATGNRKVDRSVLLMKEVTVLTTVNRRELVIDRVLALNPHVLLLGASLQGRLDWRELIGRLRALKPGVRIVYLLGEDAGDQRLFIDFLIRAGIYDFITGSVKEFDVKTALLEPTAYDEVKSYLLEDLPSSPEPSKTEPSPEVSGGTRTTCSSGNKVVLVEKIIERETVRQEYIGCITIGVAGLFPRSGVTHTALMIGSALNRAKKDTGVVVSEIVLQQLRDYYQITTSATVVDGVAIYSDYATASSAHQFVVIDDGQPEDWHVFFTRTEKLLLCPSMPWEVDVLTDFLREHEAIAPHLQYLFYPVSADRFEDLRRNMKAGGCRSWALNYSPEWASGTNDHVFLKILKSYIKEGRKNGK